MEKIKVNSIVQVSIGGHVCAPAEHYGGLIFDAKADRKSPVVRIDARLRPIGVTDAEFTADMTKRIAEFTADMIKRIAEIVRLPAHMLAGGQDWIACNGHFPAGIPEEPSYLWEVKLRGGDVMPMADF